LPNATARYLAAGGFPEHARNEAIEDVRRRLRADIVDRAIMRDLVLLGVDVVPARALFVYLVQASGSIFDAAARGREIGADPRSVRNWCRLLEDAKLLAALMSFRSSPAFQRPRGPRRRIALSLFMAGPNVGSAMAFARFRCPIFS